jgi:cysteine synthase A
LKTEGVLERKGDGSITEGKFILNAGIGQGRLTENLKTDFELIDDAVHVPDADSIEMVYRLLDEEGIFVGASSALNVAAAVQVAKKLGPGHNIVTIICDGAYRYQSRLFSKKWLEQKGLMGAIPQHLQKYASSL